MPATAPAAPAHVRAHARPRHRLRARPRGRARAFSAADADACALVPPWAFEGVARLYGARRYERLAAAHVCVIGIGGVGSWAVEALARTGVGALTLVDLDCVCETNVNRQSEATFETIGAFKVDAMAARVRTIHPGCDVRVVRDFAQAGTVVEILERGAGAEAADGGEAAAWRRPDYVLDAIDKESDKAAIAAYCVYARIPLCVTGGAGGVDRMRDIRAEDLSEATFNRLLSSMRKTLRKKYAFPRESGPGSGGSFPGQKSGKRKGRWGVTCVYAPENENEFKTAGTKGRGGIGCEGVGGSAVFVTGSIGFKAASEIVLDLIKTEPSTDVGPATTGWRSRVWPGQDGTGVASASSQVSRDGARAVGNESSTVGGEGDEKVGGAAARQGDEGSTGDPDGLTPSEQRRDLHPTTSSMAEARALDASEMFDAHCHWHLDGDHASVRALCARLAGAGMMTTRPGDWSTALAVRTGADGLSVNVPIAFGVHPWWAHLEKDGKDAWLEELRRVLAATPQSVVGEIGLDRVAVPPDAEPDYENQLDCFTRQLALATELGRPVVVHSVRATKDMTDAFRLAEDLPPRIFMHSFGGSEDFMKQLIKMRKVGDRFYFGFSSVINLRSPKTQGVIKAVPDDRLLLESDLCDPSEAEDELRTMLAIIADVKGWSVNEAARITRENAERFFATE